jgi:hypothetical protein
MINKLYALLPLYIPRDAPSRKIHLVNGRKVEKLTRMISKRYALLSLYIPLEAHLEKPSLYRVIQVSYTYARTTWVTVISQLTSLAFPRESHALSSHHSG